MQMRKNGFTMAELLIVIAVLGILAAMVIPRFLGQTEKARTAEALHVMAAIAKGEEAYFDANGTYFPASTISEYEPDSWYQLGLESPGQKSNRHFKYRTFSSNPWDAYCIMAIRCQGYEGGPGGGTGPEPCDFSAPTNGYSGTTICLDNDGNYYGNNPASPGHCVNPAGSACPSSMSFGMQGCYTGCS